MSFNDEPRLVLTLSCPDQVGVVSAVAGFLADAGGWIVESGNHSDTSSQQFFMREEVLLSSLSVGIDQLRRDFEPVANRFSMAWRMSTTEDRKRIAVFVSKEEHCLYDLLGRHRSRELQGDIVCVVSNHEDLSDIVKWHGIDFIHAPIRAATREADFAFVTSTLADHEIDVVVLARYMQVMPIDVCRQYIGRMLNIHHSFLPSFKGAKPYHQAFERGVKLVGATCHYVTPDLDEGPIIEQDVIRIDHSDSVQSLKRSGKDVEKAVLARALRWHLEDRVFVNGTRTVVFP